ncbi:glycerol kinase [Candidatus Termititenax persephonae]|uniref:glycerol kinase n=1 Tax=Candidatus Termititenax persephonae TaxID=2218525 RepID=A0A388TFY1_9BACT|nr:glycerol kinase [Candidatus Termititenax persephonae]
MQYVLAISQKPFATRVVVYDKSGTEIAAATQAVKLSAPEPGWAEYVPEEIWQSVAVGLQRVLLKIPSSKIQAIGLTSQREAVVVWDKTTGRPIYNALAWSDCRTAERCAVLGKDKSLVNYIRQNTGLTLDCYFSAPKLAWLLKNIPGAYIRALKGQLLFGTLDSWLLWKLTGGQTHATDYTNAARTMLFNIGQLRWDKKLLKKFNIPAELLPEVKNSSGLFGRTVPLGKLAANIPITGVAGDQQASLFGQTCFEPGTVKNTYDAGGFMLMNIGARKKISKHGLLTTLCCDSRGRPVYALEGSVFVAGTALEWLRHGLQITGQTADLAKIARGLPDNNGVYFVPAFTGLAAPHWQNAARGVICGITLATTRRHLVRAALEAIVYQTKDVLSAMRQDSGLKVWEVKVDGAVAENDFICDFQADILALSVVRAKARDASALGAAYLAGLQTGYWKNAEDIRRCWGIDKIFNRVMPSTQSNLLYAGWQKAVQRAVL